MRAFVTTAGDAAKVVDAHVLGRDEDAVNAQDAFSLFGGVGYLSGTRDLISTPSRVGDGGTS